MTAEVAASLGRGAAESRMTSEASIWRLTGSMTTNGAGLEVPGWETVYTELPFRLGGTERGGAVSRTVTVGTTAVTLAVRTGHMPASTADLEDNDFIEITAGDNKGRVFRIVEAGWQDQSTARRVPLISEQRPEEWS